MVSKPSPKNTISRSRMFSCERERVHRGIDHAHVGAVGLGLQQAFFGARHAHRIAEGGENDLGTLGDAHAIIDAAHRQHAHWATGPMHKLDRLGQHALDAIAEYRMRVTAAHLHDMKRPILGSIHRRHQVVDFLDEYPRLFAVAELIDIFHAALPFLDAKPRSSASSVCTRSQAI